MLVSFGMEVPGMVEDILSDEYEEGEILDDDILYENVSSLEEFSDVEDKKGVKAEVKRVKTKRKKEHKCKIDCPCRVERSGKHCYARIRKRSSSGPSKNCGVLEDPERKQRLQSGKAVSPNRGFKRDTFSKDKAKSKGKSDARKRCWPYYFQHDNRLQPPKKVVPDRRCKKVRRFSVDDHRDGIWKRKSRSPSPKRPIETGRAVAKSSLLERLVGSGSMHLKTNETDGKPTDSEGDSEHVCTELNSRLNVDCNAKVTVCPCDIPVPPTPKAQSPEPPKQEIEELHLRLNALKTAIMKKHTDLKRKKRLAASKKRDSVEDSFTEFAMSGLLEEGLESDAPTPPLPPPPPPGTDWPLVPLDDNRWSDEDMVIDAESVCGDVMIESNIPASDPSLQSFDFPAVSSPASHRTLPCCRGNPIPVITPHRRSREIEPVKKPPSSVIPLVFDSEEPPSSSQPPKYLKEINSNRLTRGRRRSQVLHGRGKASLGWLPRKRRNSLRHRKQPAKSMQPERPKTLIKDDDDEDELRQLALMSVKPKTAITGGMLTSVGMDLNPLSIDTGPSTAEKINSPVKNPSPAEPWDDLDEDILRAQLLSSLSRNIPNAQPSPKQQSPMEVKKQIMTKKINKENLYRRSGSLSHAAATKPQKKPAAKFINPNTKQTLAPPLNPPKVEKFIIKVSDSETSEDEESKGAKIQLTTCDASSRKSEIELSIDRLLEETRKETELIQKASQFYPDFIVLESDHKEIPSDSNVEEPAESVAPVHVEIAPSFSKDKLEGTSHLPAWQQEEFERQKRVMAHKGSLIEAAKRKVRGKASTEDNEPAKAEEKPSESVGAMDPCRPEASCGSTGGIAVQAPVVDSRTSVPDVPTVVTSQVTDAKAHVDWEVRRIIEEMLTRVCGDAQQTAADGSGTDPSKNFNDSVMPDLKNAMSDPSKSAVEIKPKQALRKPVSGSPKAKMAPTGVPLKAHLRNSVPSANSLMMPILERASPAQSVQDPAIPKRTTSNAAAKSPKTQTLNGLSQKPQFAFKDSSYAVRALNEMVEMVTGFESGMKEYGNLKKEYLALRKQLVAAHQKMSRKRQELLGMKGTIENKKRLLNSTLTMDTSSLSPLPDIREQPKPSTRDSELFSLRYKEICLRAQFAMMGLEAPPKPGVAGHAKNSRPLENPVVSPRKRLRLRPRQVERLRPLTTDKKLIKPSPRIVIPSDTPVVPKALPELPSSSKKLVISVHDKDRINPLIPLCPYDMTGVCKDEECKYQHLRTE